METVKRYVIVQEEAGIFVGIAMGFAFWSKLDAAGQDAAPTFETAKDVELFVKENGILGNNPPEYRCVLVELIDERIDFAGLYFATMDDMEKAGLAEYFGTMLVNDLSKFNTHPSVQ